jgi:hypothetical protein
VTGPTLNGHSPDSARRSEWRNRVRSCALLDRPAAIEEKKDAALI